MIKAGFYRASFQSPRDRVSVFSSDKARLGAVLFSSLAYKGDRIARR